MRISFALIFCDIRPVNNSSRLSVFPGLMYMAQSEAGGPYVVDGLVAMALWRINIYGGDGAVIS